MGKKRMPSPTADDIERIAETLINTDDFNQIQDRDSFDSAYDEYLGLNDNLVKNKSVRESTFKEVQRLKPTVDSERIFTKAKGTSLKQDRKRDAETIVTTKQEYKQKGASKVDLKGYDTKPRKRKADEFNIIGRIKNKIVYVKAVRVTVRGKRFDRFRDEKGRFARVENK